MNWRSCTEKFLGIIMLFKDNCCHWALESSHVLKFFFFLSIPTKNKNKNKNQPPPTTNKPNRKNTWKVRWRWGCGFILFIPPHLFCFARERTPRATSVVRQYLATELQSEWKLLNAASMSPDILFQCDFIFMKFSGAPSTLGPLATARSMFERLMRLLNSKLDYSFI